MGIPLALTQYPTSGKFGNVSSMTIWAPAAHSGLAHGMGIYVTRRYTKNENKIRGIQREIVLPNGFSDFPRGGFPDAGVAAAYTLLLIHVQDQGAFKEIYPAAGVAAAYTLLLLLLLLQANVSFKEKTTSQQVTTSGASNDAPAPPAPNHPPNHPTTQHRLFQPRQLAGRAGLGSVHATAYRSKYAHLDPSVSMLATVHDDRSLLKDEAP